MVRAGHLDGPLPLACISSVKYKGDLRLQLGGGGLGGWKWEVESLAKIKESNCSMGEECLIMNIKN